MIPNNLSSNTVTPTHHVADLLQHHLAPYRNSNFSSQQAYSLATDSLIKNHDDLTFKDVRTAIDLVKENDLSHHKGIFESIFHDWVNNYSQHCSPQDFLQSSIANLSTSTFHDMLEWGKEIFWNLHYLHYSSSISSFPLQRDQYSSSMPNLVASRDLDDNGEVAICHSSDSDESNEDSSIFELYMSKEQRKKALQPCQYAHTCHRLHDRSHLSEYYHPFLPPCKYQHKCYIKNPNHLSKYSHPCLFGVQCHYLLSGDEKHCSQFSHAERKKCKDNEKCELFHDREHMMKYRHDGARDYRYDCKYGLLCTDESREHHFKYSHPSSLGIPTNISGTNVETDFDDNVKSLMKTMNDHAKSCNNSSLIDLMNKIDKEDKTIQFIFDYVDNLTPQHRCNGKILKLILAHGTLLSRTFQEEMTRDPKKACVSLSLVSPMVTLPIMQAGLSMRDHVKKWIKAIVNYFFDNTTSSTPVKCTLNLPQHVQTQVQTIIQNIVSNVKGHSVTGIGYRLDEALGTNKQVFSIVGMNTASYYGEVLFILDRKIMLHPDFNMSLEAATHYCSKKVKTWRKPQEAVTNTALEGVKEYKAAKLHPSAAGSRKLMAKDIVLFHYEQFKSIPKDHADLLKTSTHLDAHYVTEGHLPPVVPVSYVSHIVMPKTTFDTLSSSEQKILIDVVLKKKKERLHFCASHQEQLRHVMKNSLYLYAKMNKLKDKMPGRGLTFSIMYQYGEFSLLPQLKLYSSNPKGTLIELTVRGKDIGICFSPSKTIDPKSSIYILLNRIYFWKRKYVTPRTCIQRGNAENPNILVNERAFTGEGDDHLEMYVKYKIQVSSKQISLEVASSNPSSFARNSLRADISKLSLSQPLTFIHFSNWSSLVEVKWISVEQV